VPAVAFTLGFVGMYVSYEVLHRRAHTHEGIGRYGKWLRRHHFHHHFENPHMNHGVTSPIWDVAFGTFERAESIRVPPKMAMRWLCDDTGAIRPAFRRYYSLRGAA
jgi:sterol desaturase/sphingolipid hydroxylase (fatty acid hydroxylase superfamily)